AGAASDALLRRVSHDLRTPLNNVFGALEIAEVQADRPDAVLRWVAVARAASVRLRLMLDDLIAHARDTVGPPREVALHEVGVATVVTAAVGEVRGLAVARDRSIEQSVRPPDVVVTADPELLRQVLVDLLVNALVRCGAGTVEVAADAHESGVRFVVRDEADGLTDAERAALAGTYRVGDPDPSVGPDLAMTVARALVAAM